MTLILFGGGIKCSSAYYKRLTSLVTTVRPRGKEILYLTGTVSPHVGTQDQLSVCWSILASSTILPLLLEFCCPLVPGSVTVSWHHASCHGLILRAGSQCELTVGSDWARSSQNGVSSGV